MSIVDTRTPEPSRFLHGATGEWEIVIGMEVHAQVVSESKLFSPASTKFGAGANANVSFVDCAFPGMLPDQQGMRAPGGADRLGPQRADQPAFGV